MRARQEAAMMMVSVRPVNHDQLKIPQSEGSSQSKL
jgi:hypothetical protein